MVTFSQTHRWGIGSLAIVLTAAASLAGAQTVTTGDGSEAAAAQRAERGPAFCWDAHPCFRLGDKLFVAGTAAIQSDWWRTDTIASDDFGDIFVRDVARRRVGFDATVFNRVEVRVEREFADDVHPWRDRFVNVRAFDALQVRAGSFMLPFSADENTAVEDATFVFHSQSATLLAPGRDRGVQLHGVVAARRLGYELGVFDHDGQNSKSADVTRVAAGRTVAARVSVAPWRSTTRAGTLEASLAFTSSAITDGLPAVTGRTAFDAPYFTSNVYLSGHRHRIGLDAAWHSTPCSAAAEYLRLTDERIGESVEDTDLSPFLGAGWFVSGTCTVIGTRDRSGAPSLGRLVPRRGIGAVAVAVRVERVHFGSVATGEASTSPRTDVIPGNGEHLVTLGINWHPNRWVQIQADAIREGLVTPATSGPFAGRTHLWSRVFRLQFVL